MNKSELSERDKAILKRLETTLDKIEKLSLKVDEVATMVMEGDIGDSTFHKHLETKIGKNNNE